jgi:hypothetical protein
MKINIISNYQPKTGLMQDVGILRGILTAVFSENVELKRVHYMLPHCDEAEVNIFLEVVNPSLFPYAAKNILIPNPEWTYKSWRPYLNMIDEIWVKTIEAERIFKKITTTPVHYIGWSSIDKVWDSEKQRKNYHKAIIPVGKNIYRHPKPILQAYLKIKQENPSLYSKLPVLHIVYNPTAIGVTVPSEIHERVILKDKVLSETEYDDLLRECGLAICISLSEGFCHAVNESMSTGCNLILSKISPFVENLVGDVQLGAFYGEVSKTLPQPDFEGLLVDTSVTSIIECLQEYVNTSFHEKQNGSIVMRELYETRHKKWIEFMKSFLKEHLDVPAYDLKSYFPKEEDLPDVSIITITKDRRPFMPLAKYCYMIQSYPEEKLEWVIVDDGDDSIEDTLIGVPNVKYVRCEKGMTISQKRNLAVQNAMYDIVATMDDDDVYPNNSILHRVAMMLKNPSKECAFCTAIPCYDIVKYSSFMNIPPYTLGMSERVSEATLIFTKSFWNERQFDNEVHVGEGNAFIRSREHMCRELSPQEVIVSLVHPKNTSSRRLPPVGEPNGCHYGFNENLFSLVSQIGIELNSACRTESDHEIVGGSSSCVHDGGGDQR